MWPQEYFIALNQTSIYAESGGQVGDRGWFKSKNAEGSILDCKKSGKVFMHLIKLDKGSLKIDDKIEVNVNKEKREKTEAHHSATHLVHAALKRVLGDHVKQKGSLVDEHKLRFDFSHDESLSDEEISKIEDLVNVEILKNSAEFLSISTFTKSSILDISSSDKDSSCEKSNLSLCSSTSEPFCLT